MSIKVIIVEDEMLVAEDIASDLVEYGFEVLEIFISGEDCLTNFENLNPDVIIMDIHIKGNIDGIETAKAINEIKKTPIIYLTANSDSKTVQKVLDVFPSAFISKPYQKSDLIIAIEVAFNSYNQFISKQRENSISILTDSIFVKTSNSYKKIRLSDILYLEASGSYSKIFTKKDETLVSYNLSHFEDMVRLPEFKRIHRSFLININEVDGFDSNSIIINNTNLSISKQYYKDIMSYFKKL